MYTKKILPLYYKQDKLPHMWQCCKGNETGGAVEAHEIEAHGSEKPS